MDESYAQGGRRDRHVRSSIGGSRPVASARGGVYHYARADPLQQLADSARITDVEALAAGLGRGGEVRADDRPAGVRRTCGGPLPEMARGTRDQYPTHVRIPYWEFW